MEETAPPVPPPPFKDRSGWLIFLGVIEILIGSFCALITVIVMAVFLFADRIPGTQTDSFSRMGLGMALLIYGLLAMFFISTGIGTWRGRRWARLLMLFLASVWLFFGIFGILFMSVLLPVILKNLNTGGTSLPDSANALLIILPLVLVAFINILLPGAFLLFYTRKSVRDTFERKDPRQPHERRCPLPVLALSIWLAICAMGALFGLPFGVLAVFGVILTGVPAFLLTLAMAGVQGWLARGIYRLQKPAWWGTVAFKIVMGISGVISLSRIPMSELYERMGFVEQPQMPVQPMFDAIQAWMPFYSALIQAAILGYVLWVGRYFRSKALPAPQPVAG